MKNFFFTIFTLIATNNIIADELDQAMLFYKQGKLLETKNEIDKIKNKDNAKFWYYRGVTFHKLFKSENLSDESNTFFLEAIKSYKKTLNFKDKQYSSNAKKNLSDLYTYLWERGYMHSKMKNYNDALIAFQQAEKIRPNNPEILRNIAITYQKKGEEQKSLAVYKKIQKENVLYRCNQVKYFLRNKKFSTAKSLIKELVNTYPYNIACLETLHLYLLRIPQKLHNKNINEILSKNETINRYQQAVISRYQKKHKEAYETFLKLYEENPDDKVLIQLCDTAYNYAQQLILNSNNDIDNEEKYNLAQDVIDDAIFFTEKLFKHYSTNLQVVEHLYNLYLQTKQTEKADNVKRIMLNLGAENIN